MRTLDAKHHVRAGSNLGGGNEFRTCLLVRIVREAGANAGIHLDQYVELRFFERRYAGGDEGNPSLSGGGLSNHAYNHL